MISDKAGATLRTYGSKHMEIYFLYYILAINIIAFIVMGADKKKAEAGKRRTSEKTLFALALLGGSAGVLFAMYIFRHKTLHNSFKFGIPIILIIQIIAFYYAFYRRF